MKRREFLKISGVIAGQTIISGLSGCNFPTNKKSTKGKLYLFLKNGLSGCTLRLLDWDTAQFKDYDLPLQNPHSLVRDANNSNIVYVFESWGSAVRMDLGSGHQVKIDHTISNDIFMGHAILIHEGEQLLCIDVDPNHYLPKCSIRSAETLQKIHPLPVDCGLAHQVIRLPESEIAVFGNLTPRHSIFKEGGGFTFYDFRKQKILRHIDSPFMIQHLLPISSTEVIGIGVRMKPNPFSVLKSEKGTAYKSKRKVESPHYFESNYEFTPAPLFYANIDGRVEAFWDKDHRENFRFGFAITKAPGGDRFLTGYNVSNKVLYWHGRHLVRELSVTNPFSVVASADGTEFVVRTEEKAQFYSMKTFEHLKTIDNILLVSAY